MKNHIDDENPYAKLGITPIINAIGSVTMFCLLSTSDAADE